MGLVRSFIGTDGIWQYIPHINTGLFSIIKVHFLLFANLIVDWHINTINFTDSGISYTKETNTENGFSDWTGGEESIYDCTFDMAAHIVYTITVPEGYDGAVLAIERNGKDEVILRTGEETDEEDMHLLDEHDADYFIFYRLSDLIQ